MKTSLKNLICVLSNLIASIWTRSICQMQATFPGVEFLRILFKFKKKKEIRRGMSTFYIKRQIRRFHLVVEQWTSKKCTKKHDARAELLFWSLNLLFFVEVVVVVDVVIVASVTFNKGSTASPSERSQQNFAEKHDKLSTWWYYKLPNINGRRLHRAGYGFQIPDSRFRIPFQ